MTPAPLTDHSALNRATCALRATPSGAASAASEAIVSVFVSDITLEKLGREGVAAVLADIDAETGGLTRGTVEERIGVDTRRIVVEAEHGSFAAWDGVQAAAEPRAIVLEVQGSGNVGVWDAIAPGLRGWGRHLVEVDERQIAGGSEAVVAALEDMGVGAKAYDTALAFERPTGKLRGLRGRRKDYPGAVAWERKMIVVEDWGAARGELVTVARELARQMVFDFESGVVAKPVVRERGGKAMARRSA